MAMACPPTKTLRIRGFSAISILLILLPIIFLNLQPTLSHVSATSTEKDPTTCEEGDHQTCEGEDSSSSSTLPSSSLTVPDDNSAKMLYSIILPTYNERDNLPLITQFLHDTFTSHKLNYEIVVVDDSSPDNTLEVAKSLQKIFGEDHFKIVSRPGKLGLGSAYSAGLKASTGGRIVLMDADLSHHPKFIPQMIDVMDDTNNRHKVDIVSGTRYRRGGGVAGWDTFRKLTSCGANWLAHFLLSTGPASDLTGSFRLYERAAIEQILPQVHSKGYAFQMEILVRANKAGLGIGEVPITFVDRIYGESKLGANEIFIYLKGLLLLFFTT